MKITIAKTAGFCMGVRRAVEMVLDAANKSKGPIYTYGPLIHNPQVLSILEEKGISIIKDIPPAGKGTVLIRAHGVPPQAKSDLSKAGFTVIDATCPRVIKVQTIIKKHADQGYSIIIIGDTDHPEVIGLLGYAGGKGFVADSFDALDALDTFEKAIIVAQTTQNMVFFERVKQWAAAKHPHYKFFNTICDSTEKRQAEVSAIAKTVDAVIVVGGYNSGNTQRLAEIARQAGKPAFHIEKESELDDSVLAAAKNIGITAGASTPNWIIKKVYRRLETLPYKKGQRWRTLFYSIQRSLLLTNIYVALGAGCLSYACTRLENMGTSFLNASIAMLYILAMHTINNLTGRKADLYNDPDRASFYEKNKIFLSILAIVANGICLAIAYVLGPFSFTLMLAMSVMGFLYNFRIVPVRHWERKYRRLKDIPGSKTLIIAGGWGIVTALLPLFSASSGIYLSTLPVFFWATGMVFVRTAFFDILDMQGDRIVGKETIPIVLGEERTKTLLKYLLIALFIELYVSSALGLFSTLGFALGLYPASLFFVLFAHERNYMLPGFRLVFLVETHFILAGVITFLWDLC